MTQVNIEDVLIDEVKIIIEENKVEYPNIKNFVDKSVKKEIEWVRNANSNTTSELSVDKN